jgi:uncharacterized protein (TIGR01244 family)
MAGCRRSLLENAATRNEDVSMNALLTFLLAATTSVPESLPADSIPNYRIVAPGVAAAGQPSRETLAKLKELGFGTVITLRTAKEAPVVAEERKIVEDQGLRYVAVPVTAETFSLADVDGVRKALDEAGGTPVLLHCASSNRVGAVWGVIARERGASAGEAEDEAKKAGLSSAAMRDAFRKVADEAAARAAASHP